MIGKLIIYSGPSGVGKGFVKSLFMDDPALRLHFSVSATTRAPREDEVDGVHYHFLSKDEFKSWVDQDKFLEYAPFVDNYYGTPIAAVKEELEKGNNVLLEIEVEGVKQILEKMPEALTIWLSPPSLEELRTRLVKRGTDSAETIDKRIERAKEELLESSKVFEYHVVNDNANQAAEEIKEIILSRNEI